jgi:CRISP-associated protein Cas1
MLLSGRGRHFGCIDPIRAPRLPLFRAQLAALDDPSRALTFAQALVKAKLANGLLMLRRWARHRQTETLAASITRLAEWRHRVGSMDRLEALRGLEGSAAAAYFAAMGSLLDGAWRFTARRRQPPPDPVNSMLSYGYTLLYYNMLTLVLGRGLQAHLGLYHQPRAGHHALVSDLMEPFRPLAVDAVVMDLALNGGVRPGHFNVPEREGEACLMSADARRKLIEAFERKMNTRVECPALRAKLDMRRLMDLQVLQWVEVLEGRLPAFEGWVAR